MCRMAFEMDGLCCFWSVSRGLFRLCRLACMRTRLTKNFATCSRCPDGVLAHDWDTVIGFPRGETDTTDAICRIIDALAGATRPVGEKRRSVKITLQTYTHDRIRSYMGDHAVGQNHIIGIHTIFRSFTTSPSQSLPSGDQSVSMPWNHSLRVITFNENALFLSCTGYRDISRSTLGIITLCSSLTFGIITLTLCRPHPVGASCEGGAPQFDDLPGGEGVQDDLGWMPIPPSPPTPPPSYPLRSSPPPLSSPSLLRHRGGHDERPTPVSTRNLSITEKNN